MTKSMWICKEVCSETWNS